MPRYQAFTQFVEQKDREELVSRLAAELAVKAEGPQRQPFIFEQEVRQTKTVHVIVMWDEWASVPKEERGSIILDAYEKVDPTLAEKILVAVGVTGQEAVDLNVFPFEILATVRSTDPVDFGEVKKAMLDEGAIRTDTGIHLVFPTQDLASETYSRLLQKFGPFFQIMRTVSRIDE